MRKGFFVFSHKQINTYFSKFQKIKTFQTLRQVVKILGFCRGSFKLELLAKG